MFLSSRALESSDLEEHLGTVEICQKIILKKIIKEIVKKVIKKIQKKIQKNKNNTQKLSSQGLQSFQRPRGYSIAT